MSPNLRKVQQFIEKHSLLSQGDSVLVALSGGSDSVALLLMLKRLGYHCVAAHCNFTLRGSESDRDEAFVTDFCRQQQVILEVIHFDTRTYAANKHLSIEMAARQLRYDWFEKLYIKYGVSAVAVAHHRDDSVETFMLNLIRGTGINGLCGIRPHNGHAELGDYVRKGSVLAVVRSGDVASYDKEREEARQQLQLAQRNLNASKELYASGMASKKDLIISKQDMANALAEIRRINTIYHIYHLSPNAVYQIKAPVSGYVVQKSINPQMQISQNDSPVFTISGLTNVWVIANVYENDISKIHQGMPVRITTLAYPDKEFSGKIEKVYNMLDEDNKTMQVRISLSNRQHLLKPGMMANVYVECNSSGQSMPCIDQHGLIFDNGKNYVVVVKNNNKLEIREVDVYKQNSSSAYISRGLNVGERIIVKNALLVYTSLEI